jgi:hypothetical protein
VKGLATAHCDGLYCTAGQHRCTGERLEVCSVDKTRFDLVAMCGVGLCDALAKRCNVCVPKGLTCLDPTTLVPCSDDGLTKTNETCIAPAARCVTRPAGSGCFECALDSQCTASASCRKPSCANGTCATIPDATQDGKVIEFQLQGSCTNGVCRTGVIVQEKVPMGTPCDRDQMGVNYYCDASGACVPQPTP